jgi:hypothetical protein
MHSNNGSDLAIIVLNRKSTINQKINHLAMIGGLSEPWLVESTSAVRTDVSVYKQCSIAVTVCVQPNDVCMTETMAQPQVGPNKLQNTLIVIY